MFGQTTLVGEADDFLEMEMVECCLGSVSFNPQNLLTFKDAVFVVQPTEIGPIQF